MLEAWIIVISILAVVAIAILKAGVKIIGQSHAQVVERLGKYNKILDAGIHFIIPFFDRPVHFKPISLTERVADFKPQPVITKDKVKIKKDT